MIQELSWRVSWAVIPGHHTFPATSRGNAKLLGHLGTAETWNSNGRKEEEKVEDKIERRSVVLTKRM